MKDILTHIPDSLDGFLPFDSLATADTLTAVSNVFPSGMAGILHPSTPALENWVFVVMLVLFLLLVVGILQSAEVFVLGLKSFFSRKNSAIQLFPTAHVVKFQFFITLFSVFFFALACYEFIFTNGGEFQFKAFLILSGFIICFYILKYFLFEIVGRTFFNPKVTRGYNNLYFMLLSTLAMLLFPVLILYTYQPASWHTPLAVFALILVLFFYITLITRILQIFYTKPITLFYIFLHLCILEILPILTLIRVCEEYILMF